MSKSNRLEKLATRGQVLDAIRRAKDYKDLAHSEDEALIMLAGVMPRHILADLYNGGTLQFSHILDDLCNRGKIGITDKYVFPKPSNRIRPVATQYNVMKPQVARLARNPTTLRIFGRDRLALWYAAANNDLSGSRGEAYGLWLLLKFWRQPRIQKLWAQYLDREFTLPEDAQ